MGSVLDPIPRCPGLVVLMRESLNKLNWAVERLAYKLDAAAGQPNGGMLSDSALWEAGEWVMDELPKIITELCANANIVERTLEGYVYEMEDCPDGGDGPDD